MRDSCHRTRADARARPGVPSSRHANCPSSSRSRETEATLGKYLELGDGQWDLPPMRECCAISSPSEPHLEDFDRRHVVSGHRTQKIMLLKSAIRLPGPQSAADNAGHLRTSRPPITELAAAEADAGDTSSDRMRRSTSCVGHLARLQEPLRTIMSFGERAKHRNRRTLTGDARHSLDRMLNARAACARRPECWRTRKGYDACQSLCAPRIWRGSRETSWRFENDHRR